MQQQQKNTHYKIQSIFTSDDTQQVFILNNTDNIVEDMQGITIVCIFLITYMFYCLQSQYMYFNLIDQV